MYDLDAIREMNRPGGAQPKTMETHTTKGEDPRPERAFLLHPTMVGQVVLVRRGSSGFWPIKKLDDNEEAAHLARTLNRAEGLKLTAEMAEAMLVGSMFGWNVPGAFPGAYGPNKGHGVLHPEAEPEL